MHVQLKWENSEISKKSLSENGEFYDKQYSE